MTWQPLTHSDQTDMDAVTARQVVHDAEHAPLDFRLDAHDQAVAALARRCTRSYTDTHSE